MNLTTVQKIAKVLHVLVLATLVCNFIALYLVPVAVMQRDTLLSGIESYLSGLFHTSEDDIVMAAVAASALAWFWVWQEAYNAVLTLFLLVAGVCTALILRQGRLVLQAILRGEPFSLENAAALRRASIFCFVISAAALVRVIFSVWFYHSLWPLTTYNALFIPVFAVAGLLMLVMSALFRQAAAMKAENDLTI